MHSAELSRLAGVTVRALRHYHQVGVLAEPERGSNGYRRYDVHDLIRVLRIKRLASVGIPLERMPDLLDQTGDDSGTLLDELDAELGRQVERLTQQRETIARLRDHRAAPDLPPELAQFLAASVAAGFSAEMVNMDRDHAVLLAHLVGEADMPHLAGLYEHLSSPDLLSSASSFSEQFDHFGPDTDEHEFTAFVDGFVEIFASVVHQVSALDLPIDLSASANLFSEYQSGKFNEQQLRVLQLLEARIDERSGESAFKLLTDDRPADS